MNKLSQTILQEFVTNYLDINKKLSILDVGSLDVNGTYKESFNNPNWTYTGLDIVSGKNVDVISSTPYNWPISDNSYDVIISGQCMEHVEAPWLWTKEIERICKPNGIIFIIAPWTFKIHRYPVDCWRILPDGMSYIMTKHCGFKQITCKVNDVFCYFIGTKS